MITFKINNNEVQVDEGVSVMKAAQQMGIDIPKMCWNDELEHFTSCMLCLVKDGNNGRLFPSCSVKAANGMTVITDDDEIAEARQTALELLLSEHVGDCEAPCQLGCPAHMNIPLMNRLIAEGKFDEALEVVRRDIALPAVLGRICPAPCEGACHRKSVDEPVSICLLKRSAGDNGVFPAIVQVENSGYRVAVIGAGPAGLAAAYYLQLKGVNVELYDKEVHAGGQLRTEISRDVLPDDVLDKEIGVILKTGVVFHGGKQIDATLFKELKSKSDAVVIAIGTVNNATDTWGLNVTPKGYVVDRNSYETSLPGVFAIGNSLRASRLAVRSVGQGKEVAYSVWQFLNNMPVTGEHRMFNSRFGKLVSDEYAEYLRESVVAEKTLPGNGIQYGYSAEEAIAEAKRCMHCDCRAIDDCRLRLYSERYKADQRRFKTSERRKITKLNTHPEIIYEAQKCMRCGICVRLTEKDNEKFGFTYIGRGFDIEIGVPFNEDLQNALTITARRVADGCPTGAIEMKKNDMDS